MKYIRTKDRIREIIEDFGGSCNVKSTYPKGRPSIDNFTVVSGVRFAPRADTIEELCDEFVVIYNESRKFTKPFTSVYCDIKDVLKEHDLSECKIYGAIWTELGLKYVAKMNAEGELELL